MQGTVKFGAIVGVGVLAVSAVALAKRDKAAEPLGMCVEAFNAGRLGDARSVRVSPIVNAHLGAS